MPQPLPDLPPMKPVPVPGGQHAEPAEQPVSLQRQPTSQTPPLGRRLRQMGTVLASGGFVLTLGVGALEIIAKPEFRPTSILATMEARTELGGMNQRNGAKPGELLLTEADYRKKLAEAERSGQAKAELDFQKELAVVQADKERVVQAYGTLYQRANMIAQAAIQLETLAQQFRNNSSRCPMAGEAWSSA